jgi:hypothetical protein
MTKCVRQINGDGIMKDWKETGYHIDDDCILNNAGLLQRLIHLQISDY